MPTSPLGYYDPELLKVVHRHADARVAYAETPRDGMERIFLSVLARMREQHDEAVLVPRSEKDKGEGYALRRKRPEVSTVWTAGIERATQRKRMLQPAPKVLERKIPWVALIDRPNLANRSQMPARIMVPTPPVGDETKLFELTQFIIAMRYARDLPNLGFRERPVDGQGRDDLRGGGRAEPPRHLMLMFCDRPSSQFLVDQLVPALSPSCDGLDRAARQERDIP